MLISLRNLHRVYEVGTEKVHALNGVDLLAPDLVDAVQLTHGDQHQVFLPRAPGASCLTLVLGLSSRSAL